MEQLFGKDKLKISVLCRDGSPLGCSLETLYGDEHQIGVGGAEQALLTLCEAWHNAGHDVTLYNNARNPLGSPFKHGQIDRFSPKEDRDILIIFRSPNPAVDGAKGKKIWFSCDQYTSFPFNDFAHKVDKVVCISPFHAEYFKTKYGINADYVIDLPVRFQDYANDVEKVPGKCVFTSVPYRGIDVLRNIWPMIHRDYPEATLTITSDYRLWGVPHAGNEQFVAKWIGVPGVTFKGAVRRVELCKDQQEAQLLLYPCTYDELFCYTVAEAESVGAIPICHPQGAIGTTNMGDNLEGDVNNPRWCKEFADRAVWYLRNPESMKETQERLRNTSKERFSIQKILQEWNKVFQCA